MDKLGYDGMGFNDHHCSPYGLMNSPDLMASLAIGDGGVGDLARPASARYPCASRTLIEIKAHRRRIGF